MNILFTKAKYDKIQQYLQKAKKAAIVTHTNPDGDAIGSSLALYHILNLVKIEATVVVSNSFPSFLKWIEGSNNIAVYNDEKDRTREAIKNADLIFCLDFNNIARVDGITNIIEETTVPRILIDHHPNPANEFNLKFSNDSVSSTSELIYIISTRLLGHKKLPKHIAEAIFCGMMTDTGMFKHSSSHPGFFKIIANLLECGVDKDKIIHLVYNNFEESRMRLLGYCLSKTVILRKYHAAYFTLSNDEKEHFNFETGDTDGFVNYPLSINGIVLSAFFAQKDNYIKLSLRSRGNFDVNILAKKYFNGGGHKNASGGKLFCKLDECGTIFENTLHEYEAELDGL